jgi:hypothetical protein
MNFMQRTLLTLTLLSMVAGCTDNMRAKSFGGTAARQLPCGQKMVTVTWKGADLWVLTRPMREDEQPESYAFSEDSRWGIVQGTVNFAETRCK